MVNYEVTVSTGKLVGAATFNDVFIKLVGTDGESERVKRTLPPTSGTVVVKSPEGDTYNFPVYRWITDSEVHLFREGTALRVFEDDNYFGRLCRQKELDQREKDYCWDVYAEGIPHCMKATDPLSLPCEVRFSFTKKTEFFYTAATGLTNFNLRVWLIARRTGQTLMISIGCSAANGLTYQTMSRNIGRRTPLAATAVSKWNQPHVDQTLFSSAG
ncbi:hypothetical protein PFLUV_G00186910 [Perca fluviatilis]|uniref:PLAT domain-containing protein n=1 Tax=Perca fluviatilis TaxID=8168 RepID=A0A6A5DV12_PERFL|nr:hypothetical protein PFLUV_G00186910 [Perca fluviatilis]